MLKGYPAQFEQHAAAEFLCHISGKSNRLLSSGRIHCAEQAAPHIYEGLSGFAAHDLKVRVRLQVFLLMTQCEDRAHSVEERCGIFLLSRNGRGIRAAVYREIEIGSFALGEAQIRAAVPLHRSSGTCAEVAAFLGGHFEVLHADLIAIVQKGYAGKCEEEGVSKLKLGRIQVVAGADRVVVASQDGDVAKLFCVLVPIQVLVKDGLCCRRHLF